MLVRAGFIVASLTMVSRILGLVRELFIANLFGAGPIADCVNVAFKFPNLFRRIFGEGALSLVFVPIYSNKMLYSKDEARIFSSKIFLLLAVVLLLLIGVIEIFMPYLMILIAPGFIKDDAKFQLAILLCRITTPYIILISVTALFGGMLNSAKKFASFAFTPIIANIVIIIGTIYLGEMAGAEYAICIALILAGILQCIFMFICLLRSNLTLSITTKTLRYHDKDIYIFLKNMFPATMSSGVQQLNIFISQSVASFIPGAVSILSYADRLYQLPLAIIGVTFGTILLPNLAAFYKEKDYVSANLMQNKAIKISMLIALPAAFGLIITAKWLIHIIYQHGAFSYANTEDVANTLMAFSIGLPAFVIAKILLPIFYANSDTKTPFKITCYTIGTNTALNILLMLPYDHVGIAIGSSIAAWYNVWLLAKHSRRYGSFRIEENTKIFIAKSFVASVIMSIVGLLARIYLDELFFASSYFEKFIFASAVILISILCFVGTIFLFGLHKEFIRLGFRN